VTPAPPGAVACRPPQDFTDGDLIGTRIPRDLLGRPVQPGRGLLHLGDGQLITVQVPAG
jgi:DNA segregation ATPase FtsK/SpoIIIE, S-DNA-T family